MYCIQLDLHRFVYPNVHLHLYIFFKAILGVFHTWHLIFSGYISCSIFYSCFSFKNYGHFSSFFLEWQGKTGHNGITFFNGNIKIIINATLNSEKLLLYLRIKIKSFFVFFLINFIRHFVFQIKPLNITVTVLLFFSCFFINGQIYIVYLAWYV